MSTAATAPRLKRLASMQVLHDWSDIKAREILAEVRKAMGSSGATLVIMETSFTGALSVLCLAGAIIGCAQSHRHELTVLQTRWTLWQARAARWTCTCMSSWMGRSAL